MRKATIEEIDSRQTYIKNQPTNNIEASYIGYFSNRIKQSKYANARFNEIVNNYLKPTTLLPFRVSFQDVSISQYTGGQPIGIAIIGFNNYIL